MSILDNGTVKFVERDGGGPICLDQGSVVAHLATWGLAGVVVLGHEHGRRCEEACEVLTCGRGPPGYDTMHQGQWIPNPAHAVRHSLQPGCSHWTRPELSPDGEHAAVCCYQPVNGGTGFRDVLVVCSFKPGATMQSYDLHPWPGTTEAQANFEARWLPGSGAVLAVVNYNGTCVQKLHFA